MTSEYPLDAYSRLTRYLCDLHGPSTTRGAVHMFLSGAQWENLCSAEWGSAARYNVTLTSSASLSRQDHLSGPISPFQLLYDNCGTREFNRSRPGPIVHMRGACQFTANVHIQYFPWQWQALNSPSLVFRVDIAHEYLVPAIWSFTSV
jgi:hypothetical protein